MGKISASTRAVMRALMITAIPVEIPLNEGIKYIAQLMPAPSKTAKHTPRFAVDGGRIIAINIA